jgi:hypothetical protein
MSDGEHDEPFDPVEETISAAIRDAIRIQRAAASLLTVRQAAGYGISSRDGDK